MFRTLFTILSALFVSDLFYGPAAAEPFSNVDFAPYVYSEHPTGWACAASPSRPQGTENALGNNYQRMLNRGLNDQMMLHAVSCSVRPRPRQRARFDTWLVEEFNKLAVPSAPWQIPKIDTDRAAQLGDRVSGQTWDAVQTILFNAAPIHQDLPPAERLVAMRNEWPIAFQGILSHARVQWMIDAFAHHWLAHAQGKTLTDNELRLQRQQQFPDEIRPEVAARWKAIMARRDFLFPAPVRLPIALPALPTLEHVLQQGIQLSRREALALLLQSVQSAAPHDPAANYFRLEAYVADLRSSRLTEENVLAKDLIAYLQQYKMQFADHLINAIFVDAALAQPAPPHYYINDPSGKAPQFNQALKILLQIAERETIAKINLSKVNFTQGQCRPSTQARERSISIGSGSSVADCLHELGHFIEDFEIPGKIVRSSLAYVIRRNNGRPLTPLIEITHSPAYEPDEKAYEGDFFNPYIAKHYNPKANVARNEFHFPGDEITVVGTEVTSMGLQHFVNQSRAKELMLADGELFFRTLRVIRPSWYR